MSEQHDTGESAGEAADEPAEEKHDLPSQSGSRRGSKEASDSAKPSTRKKSGGVCPVYFGVKSYLHNFYDAAYYKDPSIYEDDDFRFLLHPHSRRRRCPPVWWKISMWVGINLLLFGIVGILVGYLVPQKISTITFEQSNKPMASIDTRSAAAYNTTLEMCKLVGLIMFCLGGMTLAVALLMPSFLTNYCDDDLSDESIRLHIGDEKPPLSPIEMAIPSSSKVSNVQPVRSPSESRITQDGMVEVKD